MRRGVPMGRERELLFPLRSSVSPLYSIPSMIQIITSSTTEAIVFINCVVVGRKRAGRRCESSLNKELQVMRHLLPQS